MQVLLVSLSFGCGSLCAEVEALSGESTLLAIGDSILATNARTCQSIPHHAALSLGRPVDNRAVSGRSVSKGSDRIPAHYEAGDWDWVIVDGGANDIVSVCGAAEVDDVIDGLASADVADGDMVELVDRIVADGARVILLGYYPMKERARYGFDDCAEALAALNTRYQQLAESRTEVEFVFLGEVIDPEDTPDAYRSDRVHPSPEGSKRAGELVAERIREVEARD
ncbi:MAG: SGNH/GDSL hydrolase family protein [Nannocystaceae bacterium]